MKIWMNLVLSLLVFSQAHAGPSISGGVPPHPAFAIHAIVKPVAGKDYPTEMASPYASVLQLWQDRIPIVNDIPVVDESEEIPVVRFSNGVNLPLSLRIDEDLTIETEAAGSVRVQDIVYIEKGRAGIDFPTDGPPNLRRTYMVLVMANKQRILLK